jgi:hypothetical protein
VALYYQNRRQADGHVLIHVEKGLCVVVGGIDSVQKQRRDSGQIDKLTVSGEPKRSKCEAEKCIRSNNHVAQG